MGMSLAFSPFIAFAMVDRLIDPTTGLWVGTLTSAALLRRDLLSSKRSPKILEIGTFLLFGGLATYALLSHPAWSVIAVRLRVDAGLLLIVLVSMAVGRPFTLQYLSTPPQPATRARFIATLDLKIIVVFPETAHLLTSDLAAAAVSIGMLPPNGVCLSELAEQQSVEALSCQARPEDLAVIVSSGGSTGVPKGSWRMKAQKVVNKLPGNPNS